MSDRPMYLSGQWTRDDMPEARPKAIATGDFGRLPSGIAYANLTGAFKARVAGGRATAWRQDMKTQQSAVNRNSSRGWTRSPLLLTAAAMGALVLSGCGAAQLVNVWRDPDFQGKKIRSVLVVSQRPDPAARRLWEDAVSAQMNKQGVEAVPSYQIFPDSPPPKSRMTRALEDRGLDGGLIMKPLRATAETRWVPGWTSVEPRSYYDPWANAHVIVYRHRWHPGYAVSDRYAREEVTLWSAEDDGRMVWAGTVEVENPSSPDDLRKDLAKGVVPEMKKAGLI